MTAIIGVNAAGKTALLDAIALSLLPLLDNVIQRQRNAASLDRLTFYREFAGSTFAPADVRVNAAPQPNSRGERTLRVRTSAIDEESDRDEPLRIAWEQEAGIPDAIGHSRFQQRWLAPEGIGMTRNGLYVPAADDGSGMEVLMPAFAYYRDSRDAQFLRLVREGAQTTTDPDAAHLLALGAAADFSEAQRWFYVRENRELRSAKQRGNIDLTDPVLSAIRASVLKMLDGIEHVYADEHLAQVRDNGLLPLGMKVELNFVNDQYPGSFQGFVPGRPPQGEPASEVDRQCHQVALSWLRWLKLSVAVSPLGFFLTPCIRGGSQRGIRSWTVPFSGRTRSLRSLDCSASSNGATASISRPTSQLAWQPASRCGVSKSPSKS